MEQPISTENRNDVLHFQCNLCARNNALPISAFDRESRTCAYCNSTVRMRQLCWMLSRCLFERDLTIPGFPEDKSIIGTGMTDPSEYAVPLSKKLGYANSFFDGEPRLDITKIPMELEGCYDFLISSEVFEHVLPPVSTAFINARRLLKKGGYFIFSVPYGEQEHTLEHFPDLHRFEIRGEGDGSFLVNRTAEGDLQVRHKLIFHPGRGETLEMRFFSVPDIIRHLSAAGFADIKLWNESYLPFGIHRAEWCGAPFSARAA